jgi:hypothetical protein
MQHCQVLLDVQYSTQALHVFKKRTLGLLKHSSLEKYIVYSNTRATVYCVSPKLCANGLMPTGSRPTYSRLWGHYLVSKRSTISVFSVVLLVKKETCSTLDVVRISARSILECWWLFRVLLMQALMILKYMVCAD